MYPFPLLPIALAWLAGMAITKTFWRFLPGGVAPGEGSLAAPGLLVVGGLGIALLAVVQRFSPASAGKSPGGRCAARRRRALGTALLLLAVALAGGGRYWGGRAGWEAEVAPLVGTPPRYWRGTLEREPTRRGDRVEAVFRLQEAVWPGSGQVRPARARVLLRVLDPGEGNLPSAGQRLSVYGWAEWPSPPRNPGEFDYPGWLRAQGVVAILHARGPAAWREEGPGNLGFLSALPSRLRGSFLRLARRHLPPAQAAVLEGMVLGAREDLPPDLEEAFRRSGLAHLLAVSGSNVALVAGTVGAALAWAGALSSRLAALLAIWLFAATAAGGPSVERAAVMASVLLAARLLGRRSEPLNNLALAVLALTARNPSSWEDLGFWLSVTATAGILGLGATLSWRLGGGWLEADRPGFLAKFLRSAGEMWAVTLAAQAAVFPVSLLYFPQFSLVAPLSNLLALPLVGVVTVGGVAAALGAALHPALALLFWPLGILLEILVTLARFFAHLPGAAVPFPVPRWPHLLAYYLLLAWACGWVRWSALPPAGPWTRPRLLLAALLCAVLAELVLISAPPRRVLQVAFLSVGQGDATLFYLPGGPALLVDGGPAGERYDAGEDTIVPFLRRRGIRRLDLLVITHGHADHAGGAAAVLARVPVREVWLGPGTEGEYACLRREGMGDPSFPGGGTPIFLAPRAGTRQRLAPGWEVAVLHPHAAFPGAEPPAPTLPADLPGENDLSLVLLVTYGRVRFLLAGDIERAGEEALLARFSGPVEVLKVPHHGGAASAGWPLLQALRPRYAVVQVGSNPFGHPHPATLERLGRAGARVFRTDHQGAVLARTDGRRLYVRPWLHFALLGPRLPNRPG